MGLVLNLISKAAFNWRRETIPGQILRLPLRVVPKEGVVPILSGAARGMKWTVGAGVADFWVGTYETEKAKLFERHVKSGWTVYDVGANVGFYTLIASRAVGSAGRVVAFEPSPRNLRFLRNHLGLNHNTNVSILDVAVSDSEGITRFAAGGDPKLSKISPTGDISVRTASLDHLMGELPPPDLIEMDIEGAEYSALRGADKLLRKSKPIIFLSTHGREVHRACCELLGRLGYKLHAIGPQSVDNTDELFCTRDA